MTGYVVDASVAIKWFVPEPDSALADRVLGSSRLLAAPEFMRIELANALWKNVRNKAISRNVANLSLHDIGRVVHLWHSDASLIADALKMAMDLGHPVYDCIYIALASRLGFTCITADKELIAKLVRTPFKRRVEDLASIKPVGQS